jgi:hypothetical protein
MPLKVVGAGVGRTGTHSLKLALEQLLTGRCHHMVHRMAIPGARGGRRHSCSICARNGAEGSTVAPAA